MVGHYNPGVPSTIELENNGSQKKYTVNRRPDGLVISKPLCTLMAIGALLLAILVGLLVFFFVPRCGAATTSESLKGDRNIISNDGSLVENSDDDSSEIDERLPKSIEPSQYRLQIRPHLNNLTTHGAITMVLVVNSDTNEIIFNARNLTIHPESVSVEATSKPDKPLPISNQGYIPGEKYRIVLNEEQPLVKNTVYTLELMFDGSLAGKLQGFYRSQYEDETANALTTARYLASTQFSPTDARQAFPCFDEPFYKANFTISIARPRNLTSISNMPLQKSEIDAVHPNWIWDHYAETPKMSTYLVAFIVSDLQAYGSSDRLIKSWSRQRMIYETRYAAELSSKVLRFFENYFNIRFPLPKIDMVAVPDFGYNAMENWGLITFRESAFLYNSQESDIDKKRDIAVVLSHELAHQWFGNLVTPKWWEDLWLKEGFATYLEYLGTNFAEPSWKIREEFLLSETLRAYDIDALKSSRPIHFKVKSSKQIRQTFDELSYAKGACIIRMMNHLLGEDAFRNGLINFLKKHEYGNVDRVDLFNALTEEGHKAGSLDPSVSIKEVMETWTDQPGFPVITAIADRANNQLVVSQKRFLYTNGKDDRTCWWVPISLITQQNPDFGNAKPTAWLRKEPSMTIAMNRSNWYLLNVNSTGYYIVNYDETNWKYLAQNIMDFPSLVRAQLISDSMDLARANLLDYHIPLKMIAVMATRDSDIMFVPTSVAFKKLRFLGDILSNTAAYGLFEDYQSTIFANTYKSVESDQDYYSDDYLKQRIHKAVLNWACRKSDSECSIRSHHLFREWMKQSSLRIPPNLRDVVYCTAIRQGTEAEWNFAFKQYLQTSSVSERNVLLNALGCTTKKWLLSRYLESLVENNTSIRIQDADRVFTSIADNNMANGLAFDFLRMNWDKLIDQYGDGFNIVSKMVKSLPRYMNTEYQLNELIRFKNQVHKNIGSNSQAFDSTIEKVRANVEWIQRNYHSVERWFNDHKHNFNYNR